MNREGLTVIDLFAGPGGLSEGFCSVRGKNTAWAFDVCLSVEREFHAHRTLELRSLFRNLSRNGKVPEAYYDFVRGSIQGEDFIRNELFAKFSRESEKSRDQAWLFELGDENRSKIHERISRVLRGAQDWVLIGGPPCQAYSLVGRARIRGNPNYVAEQDVRQTLYLGYMQVIAEHQPTVFVMENVQGLLSATLQNQHIFQRIVDDLRLPGNALEREGRRVNQRLRRGQTVSRYRIYSVIERSLVETEDLKAFVVRMEDYGIPQTRHRVILLGIRDDMGPLNLNTLSLKSSIPIWRVVEGLPRLRSGISKEPDSFESWSENLHEMFAHDRYFESALCNGSLRSELDRTLTRLRHPRNERGEEFIRCDPTCDFEPDWFLDQRLEGVSHHATRSHIRTDLYRYQGSRT